MKRMKGRSGWTHWMKGILCTAMLVIVGCITSGMFGFRADAASGTLMIESVEISKGDFAPGTTSTLRFKIKNEGATTVAKNVLIKVGGSDAVTPIYGESNQKYIPSIMENQVVDFEVKVDLAQDVDSEKVAVSLDLSYELGEGKSSNTATVYIPVQYNSGIVVNGVSVAENAKLGSKALISVTYANDGDSTLKDVTFHIDGNIEEETKDTSIGNLETGVSDYKDIYVIFNEKGEQTVDISVSYTNMDGKTFTKDVSSEVITVTEEEVKVQHEEVVVPAQQENSILKKLLKVGVLLSIIVVFSGIIYMITKKKD